MGYAELIGPYTRNVSQSPLESPTTTVHVDVWQKKFEDTTNALIKAYAESHSPEVKRICEEVGIDLTKEIYFEIGVKWVCKARVPVNVNTDDIAKILSDDSTGVIPQLTYLENVPNLTDLVWDVSQINVEM